MNRIIYLIITLITKLHNRFMALNDDSGLFLSDKQLHFLIIGFFGFCMIVIIQPVFRWLARNHAELIITFLYVFTIVIVVSFAIELGQAYTGTGTMELMDIASGILGYLVFSAFYLICYLIAAQFRKK